MFSVARSQELSIAAPPSSARTRAQTPAPDILPRALPSVTALDILAMHRALAPVNHPVRRCLPPTPSLRCPWPQRPLPRRALRAMLANQDHIAWSKGRMSTLHGPGKGGPCVDAAHGLSPDGGALPHRPPARAGTTRPPPDSAGEARGPPGGADAAPGHRGGGRDPCPGVGGRTLLSKSRRLRASNRGIRLRYGRRPPPLCPDSRSVSSSASAAPWLSILRARALHQPLCLLPPRGPHPRRWRRPRTHPPGNALCAMPQETCFPVRRLRRPGEPPLGTLIFVMMLSFRLKCHTCTFSVGAAWFLAVHAGCST
jgi:hypothetical protein